MASNHQHPQSYGSAALGNKAGRNQRDPLNLTEYMMTDSRRPRVESLLQQSAQSPSMESTSSATMLSPFPDFNSPFQHSPSAFQGPANSYDRTHLPHQNPVREMSEGQNSPASAPHHRPGTKVLGEIKRDNDNGGIDELDTDATPENGQDYGMSESMSNTGNLRDESVGQEDERARPRKDGKAEPPPAWSEMKTKAGKERKRLPLACIACRRKKIRCSGEKPACKHCLRSRIPCVYKITTRKAAPRTDYMAMLDKRLKRMEERVIKLIPKESLPSVSSVGRAIVKPPVPAAPVKATGSKKRAAEEAFGPELEEWVKSKPPNPAEEPPSIQARGQDAEENRLMTEGAENLPPKDIQEHLAEVYFEYVYGQSYHLLHKPSFMRKLNAGTVPPVLILAVCAVSARFSSHPQLRSEPAFLRGENWASVAREIALKRYDTPNILVLIVYLLLGLHEFGTCQGGRSWMLGGMAQRMAFALQLHKDLDHDPLRRNSKDQGVLSSTDRELRRRTMWSCFLMDRFNSSGTDRPMFMMGQFIRVQLPIKEYNFQMEIPGSTERLSVPSDSAEELDLVQNMGVAAYLVRAVSLWGEVVKYMNLGGKEEEVHPMWSPQSTFQELRRSANRFIETLPAALQYNPETLRNHATEKTANQFLFMHIVHTQTVLFLHRFALPSIAGSRPPRDAPANFLTEAARTALHAANRISELVNVGMEYPLVAPFAGYCAFYSSTVHVHGVFSKNPKLEATAKRNLAYNVKFLTKMKKYWGMYHFIAENLKELYRQHADAALRGSSTPKLKDDPSKILQYGDWFDKYPHGVSATDYEDPAAHAKKELGTDAVLGQKSDLQSVEEFFASLSPPSRAKAVQQRKAVRKSKAGKGASQQDAAAASSINATGLPDEDVNNQLRHQQQTDAISASHDATDILQNFYGQDKPQDTPVEIYHDDPLLFQPQQQGMLSQLDRQFVLSSYTGMDAATAASLPHTSWNFDLSGLGNGVYTDPSTAWFMPFNLDPPETAEDAGIFGVGQGYGLGFENFGSGLGGEERMQGLEGTGLEGGGIGTGEG